MDDTLGSASRPCENHSRSRIGGATPKSRSRCQGGGQTEGPPIVFSVSDLSSFCATPSPDGPHPARCHPGGGKDLRMASGAENISRDGNCSGRPGHIAPQAEGLGTRFVVVLLPHKATASIGLSIFRTLVLQGRIPLALEIKSTCF